jgi:hypothetical protein
MSRYVTLTGAVEQIPPHTAAVEIPPPVPIAPLCYGERTARVLGPEQWLSFFDMVHALRRIQQLYDRTLDPVLRRERDDLAHRIDVVIGCVRRAFGESVPPCPNCGRPMSGTAPQYQCPHCGTVAVREGGVA